MQQPYTKAIISKSEGNQTGLTPIESQFTQLVTLLMSLESVKNRAIYDPDGGQLILKACDDYCQESKRTLRNTIQTVDRMIEDLSASSNGISNIGAHFDVNMGSPKRYLLPPNAPTQPSVVSIFEKETVSNYLFKQRSNTLAQKALDHWKMYCVSKRMKKALDDRHSELVSRLEVAQRLAEGAKGELMNMETKDMRLRDDLTRNRSETAGLVEKLSKTENRMGDMQKQITSQLAEIEGLKATNKRLVLAAQATKPHTVDTSTNEKLKAAHADLREMNEQLSRANDSTTELSNELAQVKRVAANESIRFNSTIAELQAKLADALAQAEREKASVSALLEKESKLNQETLVAKNSLFQSNADLSARLAHLENQLSASEADVQQFSGELKQADEEIDELNEKLENLTQELSRNRSDTAGLVEKLSKSEYRVADMQKVVEGLEAANKQLVLAAQAAKAQASSNDSAVIEKLKIAQAALQEELSKAKNSATELSNELTQVRKSSAAELAKSNSVLSELQLKLTETITRAEQDKSSLSSLLEKESKLNQDILAAKNILLQSNAQLSSRVVSLETQLNAAQNDMLQLQAKLTDTLSRAEREKASVSALVEKESKLHLETVAAKNTLLQSNSELLSRVSYLEIQLKDAQTEKVQLQAKLADTLAKAERDKASVSALLEKETNLKQETLAARNALMQSNSELSSRVTYLENQLKEAQSSSLQLQTRLADTLKKAEQEKASIAALLDKEVKLSQETLAEKNRLIKTNTELSARIPYLESQPITAQSDDINQMHTKLAESLFKAEQEKASVSVLLEQERTLKQEVITAKNTLYQSNVELSGRVAQLEKQLMETLARAEQEKSAIASSLEKESKLNQDSSAAKTALLQTNSQLSSKIMYLQDQLKGAQADMIQMQARLADTVTKAGLEKAAVAASLEKELKLSQETLAAKNALSQSNAELSSRIAQLESQLNTAQADVRRVSSDLNLSEEEIDELNQKLEKYLKERSLMVNETAQLKTKLAALDDSSKREKQTLVNQLDSLSKDHASEIERLKQTTTSQSINIDQMRQAAAREVDLMSERVQLTNSLEKLRTDLNAKSQLIQSVAQLVGCTGTASLSDAVKQLLDQIHPTITFRGLSKFVSVTGFGGSIDNGIMATYIGANKDDDMSGCLITNTPLPLFPEGVYFELKISQINNHNPDGLTIGVTLTPPWDKGVPIPNTLDDISQTWAVGYNGQTWNSAKSEWKENQWCGKDLQVNQRVGLLIAVPPVSQLFVFVDDVLVCKGPNRMPSCLDNAYYGLADLLGNCDGVNLMWHAKPPTAATDLVPMDPTRRRTIEIPKLPLKPTRELSYPVRPPSVASSDPDH